MQPRLHTGRSPRAAVLAPNITCILDKILDRGWHRGGIGGAKGVHRGGEYVHSLPLTRSHVRRLHGPVGAWDVALGGLGRPKMSVRVWVVHGARMPK